MWESLDILDYKTTEEIADYQNIALQKHMKYLVENSTHYKSLFEVYKIDIKSIKTINDLINIPTTTKTDLEKDIKSFQCVKDKKIVEYVTTSGTLGSPIAMALTKADLDRLKHNEKRSLKMTGITEDDTVQITTTLDKLFMAGMAYYMGAVEVGAAVIRSGIGNPGAQWENISRFSPSVVIGVPSFILKLGHYRLRNDFDPNKSSLKKAICIGEPVSNADFSPNKLKQKIKNIWNLDLYSTYASTEMMTAFTECKAQKGGHQLPELIITEILDENGNPVASGEIGEVTVTPLGVEGMPVLRYRTGDLARAHTAKCSCGRNTMRLGPVETRKNQMIKYKGTTLFPQSIEEVLHSFDEIELYIIEILTSSLDTDHVRVYVLDTIGDELIHTLKHRFGETIKVTPEIVPINKKSLVELLFPKGSRKPKKFIDNRD